MQLCDKLNEKNIFFPLESNNRLDAIEKLLNHLKNNGFLKATEKLFKQILYHIWFLKKIIFKIYIIKIKNLKEYLYK